MQHLLGGLARGATGRIARHVVADEGVNLALRGRQAEWAVAPRKFTSAVPTAWRPNESADMWKNGVGSTSSSARANADLPELEVPFRRMMRPSIKLLTQAP